jgi:hypothetical protein
MTDLNLPKQAHGYQKNEEADCGADFFFSAITSSVSIPSGMRCRLLDVDAYTIREGQSLEHE